MELKLNFNALKKQTNLQVKSTKENYYLLILKLIIETKCFLKIVVKYWFFFPHLMPFCHLICFLKLKTFFSLFY